VDGTPCRSPFADKLVERVPPRRFQQTGTAARGPVSNAARAGTNFVIFGFQEARAKKLALGNAECQS
jgi:hypothetical protein